MSRTVSSGWAAELAGQSAVLGRDEEPAVADAGADGVPVEIGFREQQHGMGRQALHQLPGRVEQCDGLRRKRHVVWNFRIGFR